jgi:hypothetical protein
MRVTRVVVATLLAIATLVGTAATAPATSARHKPEIEVLLDGLSSPKGLALSTIKPKGSPVVAQGAFGPPGPVLLYVLRGRDRGTTIELTEPFNIVDLATSRDGSAWAIGGDLVLFRQDPVGVIAPVLDIAAYQQGDPDPNNTADDPTESNPYGLAVLRNGDALVTDAANNDLLRVTPDGDTTTMAVFDTEVVSTDHIPGFPEPTVEAEAVPTTVTVGKDGAIYVGELQGFPFRPGTSDIWRIDPHADGAVCSLTEPDPDCSHHAGGFTAIQDIAFNTGNGTLYVYELAADGVLAFEEGLETGDFPPAVLLEVRRQRRTELAAGLLSQPGGVAVGKGSELFVTDGMFSDGRLIQVRR